jgi:hypothetical protein
MLLLSGHRRKDNTPILAIGLNPDEITRVQHEPIRVALHGYPAEFVIMNGDNPTLLRKHLSELSPDPPTVVFTIGAKSISYLKTGTVFFLEPEVVQVMLKISFPRTIAIFYAECRNLGQQRLSAYGVSLDND